MTESAPTIVPLPVSRTPREVATASNSGRPPELRLESESVIESAAAAESEFTAESDSAAENAARAISSDATDAATSGRAIRVVGLTGGIACGKSAVAAAFARLGIPVLDADVIARQVVQPGSVGLREIVDAFGERVLLTDGSLDRKGLADIVFADATARARLNAITHPKIAVLSRQRLEELAVSDAPYVIYEASLLVENGTYKAFDALVVVTARPETQRRRLMERDGIDETAAEARINAQLPLEAKVTVADFVIVNDDGSEELAQRVREVHEALLVRVDGGRGGSDHVA